MAFDLASVTLVFFAAMAWGANRPWSMALFSAGAILLLAARLIWDTWHGRLRLIRSRVFLPLLGLLVLVGLQRLSPRVELGSAPAAWPHTVEPHTTGMYLLLIVGYFCLLYSVIHGARSREQLSRLVVLIIGLGVFESIYGLVQSLGGVHYIWAVPIEGDRARGTLLNYNHYALLLNLTLSVGIGYLYTRSRELFRGRNLTLRRALGMTDSPQLAGMVIFLALMGLGVFSSLSRMGIFAMFVCLAVMLAAGRLAEGGKSTVVLVFSVLLGIVSLALFAGVDTVIERYANMARHGYLEIDRIPIWRAAWPMIRTTPWFGKGLGSFQWTFPAYETLDPDRPALYAHNDYLQAVAEIGVVGLALVIWAFAACWRTAKRNLRARDPMVRGIGLATLGALAATAVQEITDFSIYIPAVAALLVLLVGLNERASLLEHATFSGTDRTP